MDNKQIYKHLKKIYGGIKQTALDAKVSRNTVKNCLYKGMKSRRQVEILEAAQEVLRKEADRIAGIRSKNRQLARAFT